MSKGRKRLPPSEEPSTVGSRSVSESRTFELRYTQDAAAEIKDLDGSVRTQLRKVLEKKLSLDPDGYGLPLRGPLANYWKHEFGNHRIVYRIYSEAQMVVICAVGVREQGDAEDIYRQLESVARTGRLAERLASALKHILPKK